VKKKGQAEIIGAVFFIILMMMAFVTYYYIYNDFSNYVYLENQKLQQQQIASAQELTQILSNANSYFQSNVSSISSAPSAPSSPPFIYLLDNQGLTPSNVYSLYMNVSVPFEFSQNNLELNGYNANANSLYLYVYAKSSGNYVIIGEYLLPPTSMFDLTIPVSSQYILNHEIELLLKSYVITISSSSTSNQPNYVNLTITNSQNLATPAPFQQMVYVPDSTASSLGIDSNAENVMFLSGGSKLYSWFEGNNGTGYIWWVKLPNGIPASSSIQIQMNVTPGANDYATYYPYVGEAPQLSPTYGQYDNGQYVFSLYSNFYDTLAGYSAQIFSGNFAPTPTTSPYKSVELIDNSYYSGAYILSPNNINPGNYILQTYWSYSGSADGLSVSIWGNPNKIYAGGGGWSPGMSGGLTYHYEFYTSGGGTPPSGNPNEASVFSLTGNAAGTFITSAPASGEGTYYVYSQIAFYNIGSNSGTVALYSRATTSASAPNSVTPAELYSPTYQSTASFSSISLSASPILFGAGTGGASSYIYIYWALMRAYPPNGIMPNVTLSKPHSQTATSNMQLTPIELSNFTFYKIANLGLMNLFNSNITTYYPNGTSFYLISNNNKNAYTLDYNNIIPESSNATLFIDLYNNNNKVDSVTISWENTHFIALIKPKNDTRYAIPLGSISGPLKITVSGNETTGLKEAIIQAIVPHVIIKNVGSYPIQIIRIWSQSNPPKYVNVSITLMPGQQVDLSGYFVNGAKTIKVVTSDGNYYSFYY